MNTSRAGRVVTEATITFIALSTCVAFGLAIGGVLGLPFAVLKHDVTCCFVGAVLGSFAAACLFVMAADKVK